jgi:DNA-binding CsgD family transcriptional regulator
LLVSKPDVIRILESVYHVDQPRDGWVNEVLTAANDSLGMGNGVGAVLYRLGNDETVHVEAITGVGITDEWRQVGAALHADPELEYAIHQCYRVWPLCGTLRELLPYTIANDQQRRQVTEMYASHGVSDQLIVHAREASGVGLSLLAFANEPIQLPAREARLLELVATHISTAYRLHRRLSSSANTAAVEAILDSAGRVAHAEPAAHSTGAREQLSEAVRLREWAQGRIRHDAPDRAIEAWKGMVNARWTLVDQLESDGKRYILARENVAAPRAGAGLSQREREVAALAALDRSNKVIAYELGIAHSTVRVLLKRACAKLGVQSREELVEKLGAEAVGVGPLAQH